MPPWVTGHSDPQSDVRNRKVKSTRGRSQSRLWSSSQGNEKQGGPYEAEDHFGGYESNREDMKNSMKTEAMVYTEAKGQASNMVSSGLGIRTLLR